MVLVNTFILSKLLYPATAFVVPPYYEEEFKIKSITAFIFSGVAKRMKRTTLSQPKQQGGIGLQLISSKLAALRINYITEIIKNKLQNPLAHYILGLELIRFTRLQYKTLCPTSPEEQTPLFITSKQPINKAINKDIAPPLYERIKTARKICIQHNRLQTLFQKHTQ